MSSQEAPLMIPLPSFHLEVPRSCSIRLIDGSKGRGLFAEQDFEAGDVIFYERPIAAMQSVENRHEAWTCAHCFDFLQSLEGQMEFHERRVAAIDIEGVCEEETADEADADARLPDGVFATDVVPCKASCGELYCSEDCRNEAFAHYHGLLCVGLIESEYHPLYIFKKHAIYNNQLFLLAAQVVALLITQVSRTTQGKTQSEVRAAAESIAKEFLGSFICKPWWEVICGAREKRGDAEDDDLSPETLQSVTMESLELLKAAFLSRLGPSGFKDPFSDGYFLQPKDSTPSSEGEDHNGLPFDCFFTFDFYSRLLGLLEMNENAIEVKSPLQIYTDSLFVYLLAKELLEKDEMAAKQCDSKMDGEEAIPHDDNAIFVWKRIKGVIDKLKVLRAIQEEDQHEEEEEEEEEDEEEQEEEVHAHDHDKKGKEKLETCDETTFECEDEKEKAFQPFPSFQGFGLFPIAAMMNHSCEPNAQVKFDRDSKAMIVALTQIKAGDELTHSYIENELPYECRKSDLAEYDFECSCPKCEHDMTY